MKTNNLEYLDFERVNNLLEGFNKSTGFVVAILDVDGRILSKPGWRSICTEFHRIHPETAARCTMSDTILAHKLDEGERYRAYTCLNGLIDVAMPIVIRGEHVANLFSGQFFFEEPDVDFFKAQAARFGFDEQTYLEALKEVPVVTQDKVKIVMDFLLDMTQLISEMTLQKMEQMELNEALRSSAAALRESEEKYRVLFNTFPLGITISDSSGNIVENNARATDILGLSKDEHEVRRIDGEQWSIIRSDGTPMSTDEYASVRALKENRLVENVEMGIVKSDTEITWLNVTAAPLLLEKPGTVITYNDITSRRKAEQEYQTLFREMLDGFALHEIICDESGKPVDYRFLDINPAFERMTGLKAQDVVGKTVLEVIPEIERSWIDTYGKVALTGEPIVFEDFSKGLDKFFEVTAFRPAPKQFSCIFSDITERKRAQERLEYQHEHDFLTGLYNRDFLEQELKRLADERFLPVSLIIADTNGLKLINDSFGHAMGDDVLRKAAELLRSHSHCGDIVARYGGDEFIMLLPHTTRVETEARLKDIESTAKKVEIASIQLTLAYGYETRNCMEDDFVNVFKKAEDMMYRNKLYESSSVKSKTIGLVINSLFAKSDRESEHSKRVSELCEFIAGKLHLSTTEIHRMRIAGLMHDIGKIGISESILNKPGKLSAREWELMKRHPETGFRILAASNEFIDISAAILEHHERWDGKGYPRGISGDSISLQARIIAVADAYDAMTSVRSYKEPMDLPDAIDEIRNCSGTHFDPKIVRVFIEHHPEFIN
jgi:diguanylate cyclase (GGDEF)-like protein/PAS domain S-box-containing protein